MKYKDYNHKLEDSFLASGTTEANFEEFLNEERKIYLESSKISEAVEKLEILLDKYPRELCLMMIAAKGMHRELESGIISIFK